MKVFIVYNTPDYSGIEIEKIFSNEEDAKKCVEELNVSRTYFKYDYEEYEVL